MTCSYLCLKYSDCNSFAIDLTSNCVVVNDTKSLVRTSSKSQESIKVGIANYESLELGNLHHFPKSSLEIDISLDLFVFLKEKKC